MDEPIRVALVDDSPEFRSELARVFEIQPGFELVAACADASEAVARLPAVAPQLVFVDLNLPGRSGVELVPELRRLMPAARMLILTIEHDGRRLIEALAAGAVGYLVKTTTPERIVDAVREAMAGGSPISSNVARLLVERFQALPPMSPGLEGLTERERTILGRFAAGMRAKEVAAELGVSVHTVRAAVRTIYSKLHAHSLAEAVAKYRG